MIRYNKHKHTDEKDKMMDNKVITMEDVQRGIPSRKNAITEEVIEVMNRAMTEPEFQGESILQTAITYENVMTKNRAGIREYIDAIKFCAYLVSMEDNYTEAYKKTFSYRDFVKERLDVQAGSNGYNELSSAASRYRRSKLVVDLLTYSQVPLDILFSGYRYKAIGVLAREMDTAQYSRDRISAAKELLMAIKGPENMKIELDIGVKETSAVASLNAQLAELAGNSLKHLEAGTTSLAKLGAMKIADEVIDAEVE